MINFQSFCDEFVKISVGRKQLARIIDAVKDAKPSNSYYRLRRDLFTIKERKNFPGTENIVDKYFSNDKSVKYRDFRKRVDPRFHTGILGKFSDPMMHNKDVRIKLVEEAKKLPKEERKKFLKSKLFRLKHPVRPPNMDPKKIEKITTIGQLHPDTAHTLPEVSDNIVWRGKKQIGELPYIINQDKPVWTSPIPGVAAGYSKGTWGSRLHAFDVSGVPQKHISPPSHHVAKDIRGMSKEDVSKIEPYVGKSPVGFNPKYERVVTNKYLNNPVAEYRPLNVDLGLWQRVRGKRIVPK